MCALDVVFFFFKQKTAYEIKECDWSSDVCSSDLDNESGEVIRQIPPDDVMKLKKTMGAVQGLVLDKKA